MEHLQNNLNYSEHFKQEIYTQTSGVQIPIEIYEGCKRFFFLLPILKKSFLYILTYMDFYLIFYNFFWVYNILLLLF